ncbi:MAG TPA: 8-oxo-dGTP diphosphatase [Candidatus Bathyarchaeia archaeon]|nr:8-oxo-dGTP diphosphatase [Candidatus Bathyarchaeia archaeon]
MANKTKADKRKFRELDQKHLRQATLCFLLREKNGRQEVLLARKKRGFAEGKFNGVGGKVDYDNGETIEEAARRETVEEIRVIIKNFSKVAILRFFFPLVSPDLDWGQEVHVYLASDWEGEPTESEEMAPAWFDIRHLPFVNMWIDDPYWLPRVLQGERLRGTFIFGQDQTIKDFEIYREETLLQ